MRETYSFHSLVHIILRSAIFVDPRFIDISTYHAPAFQRNPTRIVVATLPHRLVTICSQEEEWPPARA